MIRWFDRLGPVSVTAFKVGLASGSRSSLRPRAVSPARLALAQIQFGLVRGPIPRACAGAALHRKQRLEGRNARCYLSWPAEAKMPGITVAIGTRCQLLAGSALMLTPWTVCCCHLLARHRRPLSPASHGRRRPSISHRSMLDFWGWPTGTVTSRLTSLHRWHDRAPSFAGQRGASCRNPPRRHPARPIDPRTAPPIRPVPALQKRSASSHDNHNLPLVMPNHLLLPPSSLSDPPEATTPGPETRQRFEKAPFAPAPGPAQTRSQGATPHPHAAATRPNPPSHGRTPANRHHPSIVVSAPPRPAPPRAPDSAAANNCTIRCDSPCPDLGP